MGRKGLHPARPSQPGRRRAARLGAGAASLARVGVGLALLARPDGLPKAVGVDSVSARRMAWVVRLFAARDAALGAGAAHALLTGRPVRPWLLAQAASDGADAVALGLAIRNRQVSAIRGTAVAAFALGGCAGVLAAASDADATPATAERRPGRVSAVAGGRRPRRGRVGRR
ncbi:MAG: hypothetical protein V7637_2242 [Mycobacteriales bacterium]